jgi:parallel beta-helix repeat protein
VRPPHVGLATLPRSSRKATPAKWLRAAFGVLLCTAPATAAAQVYYVDQAHPNCSSAGPGTEAQPYCTISSALSAHSGPGITIYVKPGTYREQASVNASGTAQNPMVIQALGAGVIVDAADNFSSPSQWVLLSGDVYRAAAVTWTPFQVFMNGVRLTPSTQSPAFLPSGSFTWVMGQGLYVNAGGGNPGAQLLLVGRRSQGFSINARSWITVRGFDIRHTEDRGVNVGTGCSNLVIADNKVSFAHGYGIRVNASTNILIENNVIADSHRHGIGILAGSTGCVVRGNESLRNINPDEVSSNGIHLHASTNNTVAGNRVHDNQDSGVHFTSGANDCIAYNNVSWNNGDHGFDHLSSSGTIHSNDVAFGNFRDGFSIEGTSPNTQLHNSISVNNGLTTGHFDLWVDAASSVGFVSDYNLFWNSTAQAPIKYISTVHATLATYQVASSQDGHSLQANPKFVNAAGGDFQLLSDSPAIESANSAAPVWPATDAANHARVDAPAIPNTGVGPVTFSDRGAHEYVTDQTPIVTAPATATVAENGLLSVNVTASDPDGDAITSLTAVVLPAGATFTPGPGNTTGTLAWTPDFTQAGSYNVRFIASNALTASDTTEITVTNTDRAPVVTAPPTATAAENGLLTVNVTAADPDGAPITALEAAGLPAGATFTPGPGNTTGTLAWTPDFTQAGNYSVTFTASNALSGADTTSITVSNTDRAPVVTAPGAAGGAENALLEVQVAAFDPDGDAIASLTAAVLPAGATFTPGPGNTTGTLAWTPDFTQSGNHSVTFTASNALSGADTTSITVSNTDRAPVVTAPPTASGAENAPLEVQVAAFDPDGDAITSFDAAVLPAGATFVPGPGNTTGTLSWTPDFTQAGNHSITFTASNALSGFDATDITVTGTDRAPVVTAPATATIAENGLLTIDVTAADPDSDAIALLTAASMPPGATFTPGPGYTTGTLSWTPDYSQAGTYNVRFIATNELSGSDTTEITVTNLDRAPVVTSPPAAGVAENGLLTVDVTVADPDGDPITSLDAAGVPAGALFTPGAGFTSGTLTWTPDYTQAGGYSVSFTASNALAGSDTTVITVTDSDRAPVVTAPATATVVEGDSITVHVAVFDPDGDAIASLIAEDAPEGAIFTPGPDNASATLKWIPDFFQAGGHSVRFTAGNALSGSDTTLITVLDSIPAPLISAPASIMLAVSESLTVHISAEVPSGEPIDSLTVSGLPPGATFTPGEGNATGTLTWSPGAGDVGTHVLIFTAYSALVASDTTVIHVIEPTTDAPGDAAAARLPPRVVPNPIRHSGHLRFALAKEGAVRVDVFDLTGRLVGTPLNDARAKAGPYEVPLGSTSWGAPSLPSGVYFYRIQSPDGVRRGRFLVRR